MWQRLIARKFLATQLSCLLFIVVIVVSCDTQKPAIVLYVFPDPSHSHRLFVDGEEIEVEDLHQPREKYAKPYVFFGHNQARILEIRSSTGTDYQVDIKPGSHLVNLSREHTIRYLELWYTKETQGSGSGPSLAVPPYRKSLDRAEFGVHFLDSPTDLMAFDFDGNVPAGMYDYGSGRKFATQAFMFTSSKRK